MGSRRHRGGMTLQNKLVFYNDSCHIPGGLVYRPGRARVESGFMARDAFGLARRLEALYRIRDVLAFPGDLTGNLPETPLPRRLKVAHLGVFFSQRELKS